MKLTDSEERELIYLEGLTVSELIPMIPKDQIRLKYLGRKKFHNCCINPKCIGYEGTEEETICQKCGTKLFKMEEQK